MAFLLGCEKVRVEFPTKTVFEGVSLGVNEGDRIGIVGRNGDGKSTLLALLSGGLEVDAGRVLRNGSVRVGVLGQTDALDDAATVGQALVGDVPEYAWAGDARVRDVIAGLARDIPWDAPVGTLSGGQRRRVDLARLLMGDWDVLALDEPTNHLDVRAITWLAGHLKGRWKQGAGALLVVTHDRWFLDEVCTAMWEVHDRQVEPFEGGFSAYIMQRGGARQAGGAGRAEAPERPAPRTGLAFARGAGARHEAEVPRGRRPGAHCRRAAPARRTGTQAHGHGALGQAGGGPGAGDGALRRPRTALPARCSNGVDWIIGPGDRYGIGGRERRGQDDAFAGGAGRAAARRGPGENRPDRALRRAVAGTWTTSRASATTACGR